MDGAAPSSTAGTRAGAIEQARCSLRVTTSPVEESLARVVALLRRTRWSIQELHHRSGSDRHELELRATKTGGRHDVLVAMLRREVLVIDVEELATSPAG